MTSFILLLVCLMLGAITARIRRNPPELHKHLNWWVLYIALPAAVLELIPKLELNASLWFLFVSMWLIFVVSWLGFHWLGTRLGWARRTIGAVVLMTGLSNTAFVGLPLIEALRGRDALAYAAIADQLGCFIAISLGGALVIAFYSGNAIKPRQIALHIARFPPFIALLIALMLLFTGLPTWLDAVLTRIASTLSPLALFSVGLQLRFTLEAHRVPPFTLGLLAKLLLAPLLIYTLGRALQIGHDILDITVLQAAMAPMISAAILAERHDLDPPLANMMVSIGILLSFGSVWLWHLWLLGVA